jgi:ketosteroid isomerase-like protein
VTGMTDIDVIRAVYAAMAARDFDALFELVDPEIVITQDDRLPWGGRFEGHEGFAAFGLALTSSITSSVTIDEIFEADGDVIQVGHTRGTTVATGTPFDIAEVHRWTLCNGRAIRAHFSIDTPAMLAALGG